MNIIKKVQKKNGRVRLYFLGIKFFSYKSKNFNSDASNSIEIGKNIDCEYSIHGKNNRVKIGNAIKKSKLSIYISGNNNNIEIENPAELNNFSIEIGNLVEINNASLYIGENLCIGKSSFLLYQHDSRIEIGKDCLFSYNITMRTGELPHKIYDKITGAYTDKAKGIKIGDHLWIGESCYILKNAIIPNNCIVGSAAVVTKEFKVENALIAGNPAKICKENIVWEK